MADPVASIVTEILLLGAEDLNVRTELLARETSREALSTYDLTAPYANTVALETVSLGAAIALLNDLNWHLARFVDRALVREPSVDDDEWLSRELAAAIRGEKQDPAATGEHLLIYGVDQSSGKDRLVEPLYVRRTNGTPTYDLRDVEDTLVVRLTAAEFQES